MIDVKKVMREMEKIQKEIEISQDRPSSLPMKRLRLHRKILNEEPNQRPIKKENWTSYPILRRKGVSTM